MFKIERKEIQRVMSFFGCTALDAIYYLMPKNFIDEGRLTDFTIVDALPVVAVAAEYPSLAADRNQAAA